MLDHVATLLNTAQASLQLRADVAMPDFDGTFWDLVDAAQTTQGLVVIAGVFVLSWLALKVFR